MEQDLHLVSQDKILIEASFNEKSYHITTEPESLLSAALCSTSKNNISVQKIPPKSNENLVTSDYIDNLNNNTSTANLVLSDRYIDDITTIFP